MLLSLITFLACRTNHILPLDGHREVTAVNDSGDSAEDTGTDTATDTADSGDSCEEIRTAVTYSDETNTGCADDAQRYFIYFDTDNDGYGADYATATSTKCPETDMPPQYVTNAADCNDNDANVYPCNGC